MKDFGSHVYDDEQDTTCNTSGYTRTITPPEPISYIITFGTLQEVTQGEEAIFVSSADFAKFSGVQNDGGAVAPADYSVVSDSTKIT